MCRGDERGRGRLLPQQLNFAASFPAPFGRRAKRW
jgi:hypothetical protein